MDSRPVETIFCHCPRCGAQKHDSRREEQGEDPFRCDRCGYAHFFGPVAAVGGLIVNDAGELLLVRRASDPGKGKFGLPGGFVDRGETIEEALAREVMEETGLSLDTSQYLVSYPNLYDYQGVRSPVIDVFFRATVTDPAKIVLAEEELDAFFWCVPALEQLQQMAFPSNRQAIEFWLASR